MSTDIGDGLFNSTHKLWLRWTTVTTIVIAVAMLIVDHPLKTNHAPLGMISLQLAGSTQAAKQVVYDWAPKHRLAAAFGLGLDYLFFTSYAICIFFGSRWAAQRWLKTQPARSHIFAWLSWAAPVAGALDGVENVILLIFLQSDGRSVLYPLAFWCAVVKFLLLIVTVGIWISGTRAPREGGAPKSSPAKKA